ncbi:hypothetical protein Misp01_29850 [Microtetraspora sp. NBRC 13810]|nr:hypothetical protein Misp01_29850 [Microtetraspora sp. NBRC 13810]
MATDPGRSARTGRRDPWRVCAAIGTGALLPTTALAWLLVLGSPEFTRCLTYGEECDPNARVLGEVAWWAFWGSLGSGVLALALPTRWQRLRPAPALIQLALQAVVFTAVLGHA